MIVEQRGAWRRLIVVATLAIIMSVPFVLRLTSAGDEHLENGPSSAEVIDSLVELFSCEQLDYLYDDMYFYDSMFGANCLSRGNHIALRAYESPSSVPIVLQDVGLGPGDGLVIGHNWFVIGPEHALDPVANSVENAEFTKAKPTHFDASVRDDHEELNQCIIVASTAAITYITDTMRYRDEIVQIEQVHKYSGLADMIGSSISLEDATRIRSVGDVPSSKFQSELSKYAEPIKGYCHEQTGKRGP